MNQSEIILEWRKTLKNLKKESFYINLKKSYLEVDQDLQNKINNFSSQKSKVENLNKYDLTYKEEINKLIFLKDELLKNEKYQNIIKYEKEFNEIIKSIEMILFSKKEKGSCQ